MRLEIRDHSSIQNLSSPDPSELHVGASYLQYTSLIFYRVQVRELAWPWQNFHFVLKDPFLFLLLIVLFALDHCLDGFVAGTVRFRFFICWYLIESLMSSIWTRCSRPAAEKQAHSNLRGHSQRQPFWHISEVIRQGCWILESDWRWMF